MSEYKPETGQWRLISPSGAEHIGDSPLHAVQAESRTRIPADVALSRIYAAIAPTLEDKAELDAHMALVDQALGAVAARCPGQALVLREDIEKSAKKLMGLSDE